MIRTNTHAHIALSMAAAVALSACGGGGGSSAASTTPVTPQGVKVSVRIVLDASATTAPVSTQSSRKRPLFIASTTNGATLNVYPAAQGDTGTPTFNSTVSLASGSPLCTASSPRSCTITMDVVAGSYNFALSTFDQAPVSGVIPGTAKELAIANLSQTITADGNNVVAFHLSGIVSGAPGLSCSPVSCGAISYMSLPANGTSQQFGIGVSVYDPDGNVITGSNPYATPINVTLTEGGGSGHMVLLLNGTADGTSASLLSPSDTLAVQYDGLGASGYSSVLNIGGSPLTISPMYVTPDSLIAEAKLVDSHSSSVTEKSAPSAIAYSASTSCGGGMSPTTSGSGAAASLTMASNEPGGTTENCSVTETDILGSAVSVPFSFALPGPMGGGGGSGGGTVSFPSGGSGSCPSGSGGLAFTAAGQTAVFAISDPGYSGSFSQVNTTPATATASISGSTVTITALAAGTTTITFSDTAGNNLGCSVGATITTGSVS